MAHLTISLIAIVEKYQFTPERGEGKFWERGQTNKICSEKFSELNRIRTSPQRYPSGKEQDRAGNDKTPTNLLLDCRLRWRSALSVFANIYRKQLCRTADARAHATVVLFCHVWARWPVCGNHSTQLLTSKTLAKCASVQNAKHLFILSRKGGANWKAKTSDRNANFCEMYRRQKTIRRN